MVYNAVRRGNNELSRDTRTLACTLLKLLSTPNYVVVYTVQVISQV